MCRYRQIQQCLGRGYIRNGIFTITKPHNHPVIEEQEEIDRMVGELHQASVTELQSIEVILQTVGERYSTKSIMSNE